MKEIKIRRSVRSFEDKLLTDKELEKLVRAGMQAPSARNQQPLYYIAINKKEVLKEISEKVPGYKMVGEAGGLIIIFIRNEEHPAPKQTEQDASAATQNILLEATHLGIGSCWLSTFHNEAKQEAISNYFKLPEKHLPAVGIALGYPKDKDALKFIDRYNKDWVKYI